jgi:hypothetical protein
MNESRYKQQSEVLKFVQMAFKGVNEGKHHEERPFWRQVRQDRVGLFWHIVGRYSNTFACLTAAGRGAGSTLQSTGQAAAR